MKLFITGSNFYDQENFEWESIETQYGTVEWLRGNISDQEIIILPRHGKNHKNLPNHINYLANFAAIKLIKPECLISFSVCGVLDTSIPLAVPIISNDFFFPENRLPDGKICTIFQDSAKRKAHLIPTGELIETAIQSDLSEICRAESQTVSEGVYIHANGPRFNSKTEIKYFQNVGGTIISQTCGPEIVLANELQIPFGMVCFGVDYANGVSKTPTSPQELGANLEKSTEVFKNVIQKITEKKSKYSFRNFVWEI